MKKLLQSIFGIKEKSIKNDIRDDVPISERFANWIKKTELDNLPNNDIIAFNFGLFQSSESYKMYLIGSKKYDSEDEDWACNIDYEPNEKYFDLYDTELNNSDWEFVLNYTVMLIENFIKTEDYKSSFLEKAKHITTGFDDGNLTKIK